MKRQTDNCQQCNKPMTHCARAWWDETVARYVGVCASCEEARLCKQRAAWKRQATLRDLQGAAFGLFVVLPTVVFLIALAWPYVFEAGARIAASAENIAVQDRLLREKWTKR